jgi:hypothetical protein
MTGVYVHAPSKDDDPAMHKREILMPDGQRYLIFYTFATTEPSIAAKAPDDAAIKETADV